MNDIVIGDVCVAGVRSLLRYGGPRDAPEAIVFVHGNPGSSEDWLDILEHARELGRVVAPDMPGYGKADRPAGFDYTVGGYANHLAGILEQLGVRRAHLVLHDFGGPWGLQWAATHPAQVASVTLINIGVMPGYTWHKYARIWRLPVIGELFQLTATRRLFKLLLNADNPRPFPDAFLDRMYRDSDWGLKRAVLRLYRATSDLGAMAERMGAALEPLRLPALVLWGDGDKYVPVRFAVKQKDYFDAEVHVLHGCGHWPMVDEPEKTRSLVLPFLRMQLARGEA
ncbi:MAG: alpha/beta hydrolase [Thermoanaerobaculia bacterium]|nr:alpha/beta hydrolase [Thermoanaerobaculia bacterium]